MTRDEIGSALLNVQFGRRSFRPGYNERDVDEFLDRLRAAVVRGDSVEQLNALIESARFSIRWGGYDETKVDDYLDRVLALCRGATPSVSTNGSSSPAPPAPAQRPMGQMASSTGSALIEPRPGLLSRLARKFGSG